MIIHVLALTVGSAILAAPMKAPAEPRSVSPPPTAAGIPWQRDLKAALREAKASGKPVMVDFWAQWCEWCHKLDATTYRDPRVVESARDFVPVKVDAEGTLRERELAAQYGVEIMPTISFLAPSGRLLMRHAKFEEPETFLATLQSAREMATKVSGWERTLALNRDDPAALAALGTLISEQRLFAESRDTLQRARLTDRGRPPSERKRTRRALARAEREAGKRSEAQRLLEEALAIAPPDAGEDSAAYFAMAEAYLENGQADAARSAWQRCLDLAPDGPLALQSTQALASLSPH